MPSPFLLNQTLLYQLLVMASALVAGAIAAISGFGIGSILVPVLDLDMDIKLAVAAVSVPHLIATAVRFFMVRYHVNLRIVKHFGPLSVIGALVGATSQHYFSERALCLIFGALLIFAGLTGITGLSGRMRFRRRVAWLGGLASGLLGGLVGNQGGIRSAALICFDLTRQEFVASATAVALLVDFARMPVYMATTGTKLISIWPLIALCCVFTLAGTFLGVRLLGRMSELWFRMTVSTTILLLGLWMSFRAF